VRYRQTVDATRYGTGLTYQAFKDSMTQNRERLDAAEAAVEIDLRDVEFFRSLRPLRCVALVEDWCGDVIANLPVVARLSEAVGPALELRCFIKADVPDLATRYLNHGRFESLPVFAFFDEAGSEVGVFIERPVAVTERREADRRDVYASDPAFGSPDAPASELPDDVRTRLMAEIQARRAASTAWANRQVVIAIRDATARAPQLGDRVPHTR
jgi:Thioredoxin